MLTESVNSHLTHLEDLVLHQGTKGVNTILQMLESVRDTLVGHSKQKKAISVKIDGSPAIFAGNDPRDGRFFVATKGIFSKSPTVYKTPQEIDSRISGDLAVKLKTALEHFSKLGIKGIIQGDLLYTHDTLETKTIKGEKYVTFHPNTLVYAVPFDSELGQKILKSKIGVVWHTKYSGRSFSGLKAEFNKPISRTLRKTRDVWSLDAVVKDLSGVAQLTQKQSAKIDLLLNHIKSVYKKIDSNALNMIHKYPDIMARIEVYNNSKVRAGELQIGNPMTHARGCMRHVIAYYDKQIADKKTPRGQAKWKEGRKQAIQFFSRIPTIQLARIFGLMQNIVTLKHVFIKRLNYINGLRTFLLDRQGFRVTDQEGFVITDHVGNAVKLVDRLTFSYANFSQDILRGWNK